MSFMQRAVTARAATLAVGLTLLVYLLFLWLFFQLAAGWAKARLPLTQVPMAMQLPKYMPVRSSVNNELHAEVDQVLDVAVPVNQWVMGNFPRELSLEADLNTVVNLKTVINYQATVPVAATFELMVPLNNPLWPIEVPVKLPMQFAVPVSFQVPIDHQLPVNMTLPVLARIPEPVPVKLQALLHSQVPLKATLRAAVVSEAVAQLVVPTAPVKLFLERADLDVAIADVSLVRRSLGYPVMTPSNTGLAEAGKEALIYVYDAAKKPPALR